jgi:NadR type nicotinamide-nucleotide adenylyltransferase
MEKRAGQTIHRIAIIGPESSGKTTLAKQLAQHFNTVWVPEHARSYIEQLQRSYTLDDIVHSAKEQLLMEQELANKANAFLFSDTELIIAKVWCEDVFGTVPRWIDEQLQATTYDLYLLTDYDIPWEHDPVRENPHRREHFFNLYKKHLDDMKRSYSIISGSGDVRLRNAIGVIRKSFF